MALKIVHRILICFAIGLGLILIVFSLARGDQAYLASGVFGAILFIGGGLYLRWFLRKQMK